MSKEFYNWLNEHKEEVEIVTIDPGNKVYCDYCGKDWTDSDQTGGFIFQSKAVCPDCEEPHLKSIKGYREECFIRRWCPEDMSFADWIREIREPPKR